MANGDEIKLLPDDDGADRFGDLDDPGPEFLLPKAGRWTSVEQTLVAESVTVLIGRIVELERSLRDARVLAEALDRAGRRILFAERQAKDARLLAAHLHPLAKD